MPDRERVDSDVIMVAGEDTSTDLVEPTLPEPVRQRVIALAAAAITGMPTDEVPVSLRKVVRPNRRHARGPRTAARRRPRLPAAGRPRVMRQRVMAWSRLHSAGGGSGRRRRTDLPRAARWLKREV